MGDATCNTCGKLGHFARVYRGKKQAGTDAVVCALVATAQVVNQLWLQILVIGAIGKAQHATTTLFDSCAQVSMSGPALIKTLGLTPNQLQWQVGL